MTKVVYIGTSDTRGFSAADFTLLGVEGETEDIVFTQGYPMEVSEEVADVLLDSNSVISRDFREYEDPPPRERGPRVEEKIIGEPPDEDEEDGGFDPTAVPQPPVHVEDAPNESADSGEGAKKPRKRAAQSS